MVGVIDAQVGVAAVRVAGRRSVTGWCVLQETPSSRARVDRGDRVVDRDRRGERLTDRPRLGRGGRRLVDSGERGAGRGQGAQSLDESDLEREIRVDESRRASYQRVQRIRLRCREQVEREARAVPLL